MNKRIKMLVTAGAVVLTIALVFGGIALARNKDSARFSGINSNSAEYCWGPGQYPGLGTGNIIFNDALTNLLGMTRDEIQTQLREGNSLVEIAAALNIDEETLVNALIDAAKTELQKKVASEDLTQKQADAMLQQIQDRISNTVNFKPVATLFLGGMMPGNIIFNDTLPNLLGMTRYEIQTQLREGNSLVEIAAARNIDEETLVNTLVEAEKTRLQEAVANQDITQKVADTILQRTEENVSRIVNNKCTGNTNRTGAGPFGGRPVPGRGTFRGGMGMMGGRLAGGHC